MNIQKMMQQAQQMQKKMADVQARQETLEMEGVAAGGLVKVVLNGKNKLLSVAIDESLLKADEKETLEDLIIVAHKDAKEKLDDQLEKDMKTVTAGMSLPPGVKFPF